MQQNLSPVSAHHSDEESQQPRSSTHKRGQASELQQKLLLAEREQNIHDVDPDNDDALFSSVMSKYEEDYCRSRTLLGSSTLSPSLQQSLWPKSTAYDRTRLPTTEAKARDSSCLTGDATHEHFQDIVRTGLDQRLAASTLRMQNYGGMESTTTSLRHATSGRDVGPCMSTTDLQQSTDTQNPHGSGSMRLSTSRRFRNLYVDDTAAMAALSLLPTFTDAPTGADRLQSVGGLEPTSLSASRTNIGDLHDARDLGHSTTRSHPLQSQSLTGPEGLHQVSGVATTNKVMYGISSGLPQLRKTDVERRLANAFAVAVRQHHSAQVETEATFSEPALASRRRVEDSPARAHHGDRQQNTSTLQVEARPDVVFSKVARYADSANTIESDSIGLVAASYIHQSRTQPLQQVTAALDDVNSVLTEDQASLGTSANSEGRSVRAEIRRAAAYHKDRLHEAEIEEHRLHQRMEALAVQHRHEAEIAQREKDFVDLQRQLQTRDASLVNVVAERTAQAQSAAATIARQAIEVAEVRAANARLRAENDDRSQQALDKSQVESAQSALRTATARARSQVHAAETERYVQARSQSPPTSKAHDHHATDARIAPLNTTATSRHQSADDKDRADARAAPPNVASSRSGAAARREVIASVTQEAIAETVSAVHDWLRTQQEYLTVKQHTVSSDQDRESNEQSLSVTKARLQRQAQTMELAAQRACHNVSCMDILTSLEQDDITAQILQLLPTATVDSPPRQTRYFKQSDHTALPAFPTMFSTGRDAASEARHEESAHVKFAERSSSQQAQPQQHETRQSSPRADEYKHRHPSDQRTGNSHYFSHAAAGDSDDEQAYRSESPQYHRYHSQAAHAAGVLRATELGDATSQKLSGQKSAPDSPSARTIRAAHETPTVSPDDPKYALSVTRATAGIRANDPYYYPFDQGRWRQTSATQKDTLLRPSTAFPKLFTSKADYTWDGKGETLVSAINNLLQIGEDENLPPFTLAKHMADGSFIALDETREVFVKYRKSDMQINKNKSPHWGVSISPDDQLASHAWLQLIIATYCLRFRTWTSSSELRRAFAVIRLKTPDLSGLQDLLSELLHNWSQREESDRNGRDFMDQFMSSISVSADVANQYEMQEAIVTNNNELLASLKSKDPIEYITEVVEAIARKERERVQRGKTTTAASAFDSIAPTRNATSTHFRGHIRNHSATAVDPEAFETVRILQERWQQKSDEYDLLASRVASNDAHLKSSLSAPIGQLGVSQPLSSIPLYRDEPRPSDRRCNLCGLGSHPAAECKKSVNGNLDPELFGTRSMNLEQNFQIACQRGQLQYSTQTQQQQFWRQAQEARSTLVAQNQLMNTSRTPPRQQQPCRQFAKEGTCRLGDTCRYSHGKDVKLKTALMATGDASLVGAAMTTEGSSVDHATDIPMKTAKARTTPKLLSLQEQRELLEKNPVVPTPTEKVVNNNDLCFIPMGIRAADPSRPEDVAPLFSHQACEITSDEYNSRHGRYGDIYTYRAVQVDDGAATSAISAELAAKLGGRMYDRRQAFRFSGFTGATTTEVKKFTEVIVTLKGHNNEGRIVLFDQVIQCQVIPPGQFQDGMIIAKETIIAMRASHDAESSTWTVHNDTSDAIHIRCVSAGQIVKQLKATVLQDQSLLVVKLNRSTVCSSTHSFVTQPNMSEQDATSQCEAPLVSESRKEQQCTFQPEPMLQRTAALGRPAAIEVVRQHACDNPHDFVQTLSQPYTAWMMEGSVELAHHWQLEGLTEPLTTLQTACSAMQRGRHTDKMTGETYLRKTTEDHYSNVVELTRVTEAIQGIELLLLTESATRQTIEQDASILKMHAASINDVVTSILTESETCLAITRHQILTWTESHCPPSDELDRLRPALFPLELWALVDNSTKPLVLMEWNTFPDSMIPEMIEQALKIDVACKTECQILERPLFQAQILANIGAFFQIDAENPVMIKTEKIKIRLVKGAVPFNVKMRKECVVAQAFLRAKVAHMYKTKKLQESKSPWNNPVMCVPKTEEITAFYKDFGLGAFDALWDPANAERVATLYRLTGDYRLLNRDTIYEVFPLPLIQTMLHRMAGASRYSVTDLMDAFWTIPLDDESKEYTAFSTTGGHHEYNCLMQGGKNAANIFARIIHHTFLPLESKSMFPYQDDVNNYESDLIKHLLLWHDIYVIVKENNMVLKPTKTHMNHAEIKILGHVMSKDGRRADPSLIRAVTDLAAPIDITGVRSILGLVQVVREYLPGMSVLVAPIQALTKKGVHIKTAWNKECDACFANIKRILTSLPVLMIPDPSKPFYIHVDACRVGHGLGGVLLQRGPLGTLQPVAYWSRGLTDGERKHSATELECTALHDIILHFRTFLLNGLTFEVIVDHYALVYMVLKPSGDPHLRLDRLCLDLQGFCFRIKHRSGVNHLDADFISRMLRNGEQPFVHTVDTLRTDKFLSEEDRADLINSEYKPVDASVIIAVMNEHAGRDPQHIDDSAGPRTTATTFIEPPPAAELLQQLALWKHKYAQIIKDHSAADALMVINIMEEQETARVTTEEENVLSNDIILHSLCSQPAVRLSQSPLSHMKLGTVVEQRNTSQQLQRIISEMWSPINAGIAVMVERLLRHPVLFLAYCDAYLSRPHDTPNATHMYDIIITGTSQLLFHMYRRRATVHTQWPAETFVTSNTLMVQQFQTALRKVTRLDLLPASYERAVLASLGDQLWHDMSLQRTANSLNMCNASDLLTVFPHLLWHQSLASTSTTESITRSSSSASCSPIVCLRLTTSSAYRNTSVLADMARTYEIANASNDVLARARQSTADVETAVQFIYKTWQIYQVALHREQLRRQDRLQGPTSKALTLKEVLAQRSEIQLALATLIPARPDALVVRLKAAKTTNTVVRDYVGSLRSREKLQSTPVNASDFILEERREKQARRNQVRKQQADMQPTDKAKARAAAKADHITADERQRAITEDDTRVLADFDWLVMLEFMYSVEVSAAAEETTQLCQVINVYRDTARDQFMATARIVLDGDEDSFSKEKCFVLPVMDYQGKRGALSLVNDFHTTAPETTCLPWPSTSEDWIAAQQSDQQWSKVLANITNDETVVAIGGIYSGEICRLLDPETRELGPLLRRTVVTNTHKRNNTAVTIVNTRLQIVVPAIYVKSCLKFHHESMGHPGRNRTALTISLGYWWISLKRDVIRHTKGCRGCSLRKSFNGRAKVPVQAYEVIQYPFWRVHTDLCGPFNKTARGNQYILVIKDALTKCVEFIPIIDKTAEVVVSAAVLFFFLVGFPHLWVTDRGREVDNQWMKELKKLLSIHHIMTTPANPRSDGQVESSMGPLKDSLSQVINQYQDDWDLLCPALASTYRQTVCPQTGFTPNFLLFGRELPAPAEDHISAPTNGVINDYVKHLREILAFSWEHASERVVTNTATYNAIPKERLVFRPYTVGQWFYIRRIPKRFFTSKGDKKRHHLVAKLQMRYCGPYRITKVINPVLYEADIHNAIKRVHAVNMKPA